MRPGYGLGFLTLALGFGFRASGFFFTFLMFLMFRVDSITISQGLEGIKRIGPLNNCNVRILGVPRPRPHKGHPNPNPAVSGVV